jgi:hypothetical protein
MEKPMALNVSDCDAPPGLHITRIALEEEMYVNRLMNISPQIDSQRFYGLETSKMNSGFNHVT